jgi:probable HAF family extracellular repeat protein
MRHIRLLLPSLVFALAGMVASAWGHPVVTPDQPVLTLDEVGLYEVGYTLRGGPTVALPVGWTGGLDSPTGAACESAGVQNGREAWLLHVPWRGQTGVTFQEFTLRLPIQATHITLRGATALRADGVGKSDGVTFRVYVDGQKRLDVNRADADWQPFTVDLTPEAGKVVTLRFETDPGPKDNASFDFALWGGRQVVLEGFTPRPEHHPTPPPLDLRRLTSRPDGSVAPLSGFVGRTSAHVTSSEAILSYRGTDGTLEYRWTPATRDTSLFGGMMLRAAMTGDVPVPLPLAGQSSLDWTSPATLISQKLTATTDGRGAVLTRVFHVGDSTATVTVTARMQGKSLVCDVKCDQPLLTGLSGGDWGPAVRRRQIQVPYYSNALWYLPHENLFAGAFLDWTASEASSQDRTRANYDAKTDGTRNPLHERLVYTAAWHLDELLPNIPNPPSPFRADLSKRVMLDIWGGRFADVGARLDALADMGLGPADAILHDWQNMGYDNGLPTHVPANPALGGDSAMIALAAAARKDDVALALHENYVDYYPDFVGFTDADIARRPDGSRVDAWYNPGTKIQSFAVKPTRILALARTQGPEVMKRYGTPANYLDVHSSVPPWFHVDADATQPGAGQFATTWDAHRALWAYERTLHHGPVFGEGNNHWYWSGYLDGVEAQFGQGWRDGQGTTAPLLVDFDLLKIHPLQLNHGMGYYERWWDKGPDTQRGLLSLLDQYRMQEAAYGHMGFLGGDAWHTPSLAWLEAHLLPPLTTRTALANPSAIDYYNGGHWADATATAKASGDWSRVRVHYANGLTVWANGSETPLTVGDITLPPSGWLAQGAGLRAGTWLRQGIVSDLAETPDSMFVNARPAADWTTPGLTRLRPTVGQFTPTGPRTFTVSYRWAVGQTLPADYGCFVHFVSPTPGDGGEGIRFQQDHTLSPATSYWRPGQTVADGPWTVTLPADLPNGDYPWTIGLYQPGGNRLTLQGTSDAHSRVILGTLHVTAAGLTFLPPPPDTAGRDAPINTDDSVLSFGTIRTNGSVFVRHEGSDWVLRPFPQDRAFVVELSAVRFGHPASVQSDHGPIAPTRDGAWWRLPLNGSAVYRWPAATAPNFPLRGNNSSTETKSLHGIKSPATNRRSTCHVGTAYRITDLGTLGGNVSGAFGINNAGQVVGHAKTRGGAYHAFLWQSGKMRDLGTLGGVYSRAVAINDRGQIVGYSSTWRHGETQAFLWERGRLKALPGLGGPGSVVEGLNDNDQIVGRSQGADGLPHACLWDGYKIHRLSEGTAKASDASGINSAGLIVGAVDYGGMEHSHACAWIGGRKVALIPGVLQESSANAVNGHGRAAGYVGDESHPRLFLAQPLSKRPATVFPISWGQPSALNDTGTAVGCTETPSGTLQALVWLGGRQYDLDAMIPKDSGWHVDSANGINAAGMIVGIGEHHGQTHAYLLTPR